MALGLVAGCTPSGRPASGPIVVRIWHQKDAAERALLDELVARFNASQDSIRIETLYKETEELRIQREQFAAYLESFEGAHS